MRLKKVEVVPSSNDLVGERLFESQLVSAMVYITEMECLSFFLLPLPFSGSE